MARDPHKYLITGAECETSAPQYLNIYALSVDQQSPWEPSASTGKPSGMSGTGLVAKPIVIILVPKPIGQS